MGLAPTPNDQIGGSIRPRLQNLLSQLGDVVFLEALGAQQAEPHRQLRAKQWANMRRRLWEAPKPTSDYGYFHPLVPQKMDKAFVPPTTIWVNYSEVATLQIHLVKGLPHG